jgi:predicted negative regulator of RcsB-dependent stress response
MKEALDITKEAEEIFREIGESYLQATALVHRANALFLDADAEAATYLLEQAMASIDHEEDPLLLLVVRHNLFRYYVDLGRPDEALALMSNPGISIRNLEIRSSCCGQHGKKENCWRILGTSTTPRQP